MKKRTLKKWTGRWNYLIHKRTKCVRQFRPGESICCCDEQIKVTILNPIIESRNGVVQSYGDEKRLRWEWYKWKKWQKK